MRRNIATVSFPVFAFPALALAALVSPPAPGGVHQDNRLGYKIDLPDKWNQIPLKSDEKWIVAKYQSGKTFVIPDKSRDDFGWDREYKPEMHVIAFVEEVVKDKGPKVTKEDEDKFSIEFKSPYKDYKDYLKRTFNEGGYFIAEEKETVVNGVKATCLDIKVEKLAYQGPKRITAWVYHMPGLDLAVQFESMEAIQAKVEGEFAHCLKSFKLVKRTEGSLVEKNDGMKPMRASEMEKLSPADRAVHRLALEKTAADKAIKNLPKEWTSSKMMGFLVLNHADERFAQRAVEQGDAVLRWLEKNFDFVGKGEYARRPILRVCKDWEEENSFHKGGSSDWWYVGSDLEIVLSKDQRGARSWEFQWMNQRVMNFWLQERDSDLYFAFPRWLDSGLDRVFGSAWVRGGQIEFRPDEWEKEGLREAIRANKATRPRELMTLGGEDFYKERNRYYESAALVRFFLAGASSRDPKTRDLLKNYLVNLKAVVSGIKAKDKEGEGKDEEKPKTEEEEEAQFKKTRQAWKEREQFVLQETAKRTFGSWSETDWKNFENVYFSSFN